MLYVHCANRGNVVHIPMTKTVGLNTANLICFSSRTIAPFFPRVVSSYARPFAKLRGLAQPFQPFQIIIVASNSSAS
ncbi:hypothetical protein M433DRAFT_148042 [Acidomyces richmondensis BFW]|nr:MAG: hypothetical protein FE78DRAFT_77899 [Acidomyces sp. 'richmondensis']KYG40978.1 hypothetical protein M433DRAFT_148042 [Acidomyces richmondensis BFW]